MDNKFKQLFSKIYLSKWLHRSLGVFLALFLLTVIIYIGLAWYINNNKKEVQANLLKELNGGISGSLTVQEMDPTFLKGFPNISLRLENVVLKDSLYNFHKHTLLKAEELNVTVNVMALLRGAIALGK